MASYALADAEDREPGAEESGTGGGIQVLADQAILLVKGASKAKEKKQRS